MAKGSVFLLSTVLVIDIGVGIADLFGLKNIASAGISWAIWQYQQAAVARSAAALVVLLTVLRESEYRNIALLLYGVLKLSLSVIIVSLVMMRAATLEGFVAAMARGWNWWHPLSTVVFGFAALRLLVPHRRGEAAFWT